MTYGELPEKMKITNFYHNRPTTYTNLVGNPVDGFRCIGIYEDLQDAIDWQEGCDESCWVIEIEIEAE